jgi:hypothetical protein
MPALLTTPTMPRSPVRLDEIARGFDRFGAVTSRITGSSGPLGLGRSLRRPRRAGRRRRPRIPCAPVRARSARRCPSRRRSPAPPSAPWSFVISHLLPYGMGIRDVATGPPGDSPSYTGGESGTPQAGGDLNFGSGVGIVANRISGVDRTGQFTMKVGVISDSHDNLPNLRYALRALVEQGVGVLFHCGDLISPFVTRELGSFPGAVHVVFGNNDGDRFLTLKLGSADGEERDALRRVRIRHGRGTQDRLHALLRIREGIRGGGFVRRGIFRAHARPPRGDASARFSS